MKKHFELKVDNANEKELKEIYAWLEFEFKNRQGYTEDHYTLLTEFLIPEHVFTVYELVKWDYFEDMIRLSKEYPDAFFTLYCATESASLRGLNMWVSYFKNGEFGEYHPDIYYPENPFDPVS